MPKYQTKHMPVDDEPYIVYGGEDEYCITGIDVKPLSISVAQGSTALLYAKVFGNRSLNEDKDPYVFSKWVLTGSSVTIEDGTYIEDLGKMKTIANYTYTGRLHVDASQATNKKLYAWAVAENGMMSLPIDITITSS